MHYIIVRRGDFQLYDRLYNAFGARVPVLWDQRRKVAPHTNGNGNGASTPHEERRHAPPPSWVALGFVVVDRPND